MNAERRKALSAIQSRIEEAKALVEEIHTDLEALRDEEQEYKDNMPESFQNGEKGEKADEAISAMEDALGSLESFKDTDADQKVEEAHQV